MRKRIIKISMLCGIMLMLSGCGAEESSPQNWVPETLPSAVAEKADNAAEEQKQEEIYFEVANKVCVIGNSITLGFGNHGMASTSVETDYYHLVEEYIKEKNEQVQMKRIAGYGWEGSTTSEDRKSFLQNTLQPELDKDCDLLIIQLGDNVNDAEKLATFSEDCKFLLSWLKENYADMRIMWVFGRYNLDNGKSIQEACEEYGAEYVDISIISTDKIYCANVGDTYIQQDGTTATITDAGVASHPNDLGMQVIAEKIIEALHYK